jgi:hypothetical protein
MIRNYFFRWLPLKMHESKHKGGGKRELNLALYIVKKNFELPLMR